MAGSFMYEDFENYLSLSIGNQSDDVDVAIHQSTPQCDIFQTATIDLDPFQELTNFDTDLLDELSIYLTTPIWSQKENEDRQQSPSKHEIVPDQAPSAVIDEPAAISVNENQEYKRRRSIELNDGGEEKRQRLQSDSESINEAANEDWPSHIDTLQCKFCVKYFAEKDNLLCHQMVNHFNALPFKCSTCRWRFLNKSDFEKHVKRNKCRYWYKCDKCDFSTAYNSNLMIHKRKHNGEKPFKCPHCQFDFTSLSNLKAHLNKMHNTELLISMNGTCLWSMKLTTKKIKETASKLEKKTPKRLQCKFCPEDFQSKRFLDRHYTTNHFDEFSHHCCVCRRGFNSQDEVKKHEKRRICSQWYDCDVCHFSTQDDAKLTIHKRRHTGEKPYKCAHCDYAATTFCNLKRHNETKHKTRSL
ncbi:zinc finger protein OZF-like isoform X2 [Contarinia nasturtii]|uniref:zinc finger protein OZF-like isoform X2 n=1 Tax=Contarinia nasturtii TaxID=265458 RepID=UPI0012D48EDB|nr:zinc finger protein OZF-like isoform X2 [Contarinia nasturtii]